MIVASDSVQWLGWREWPARLYHAGSTLPGWVRRPALEIGAGGAPLHASGLEQRACEAMR
jgi:hypothetical protein